MINEISEKIRSLRKEKNLTLKDLSEKTGLSVSFLSQVENSTSSLAITSLKRIADSLDVPIIYFFDKPENNNFIVKEKDQKIFKIESSNSEFIRLSGEFVDRSLESVIVIIPPEQQHGHKFNHPGEEFVYILEGSLIVDLDGTEYIVKAGDSLHYPSTIPHIWINPLKQPCKILTVLTPVLF